MSAQSPRSLRRRIAQILAPGLTAALAVSFGISVLMLAVSLYSLQIFDRVLSSGHYETLIMLTVMLGITLLCMGGLDGVRASIMNRTGAKLSDKMSGEILDAAARSGVSAGQALRELDIVRGTMTGPAVQAVFEAPWLPLAFFVTYLLHPILAWFALGSAVLLFLIGWLNDSLTRRRLREAHELNLQAQARGEAVSRYADVVRGMGMLPALMGRFKEASRPSLMLQARAGEAGGWVNGLVRAIRLGVQGGVMGLGAYLVIERQLTGGGMIAASILTARALAPVEQLLGSWRSLVQARDSLERLEKMVERAEPAPKPMPLPDPDGRVAVEGVSLVLPDGRQILKSVSFRLEPGTMMGVVGPSAAGKSTLCRVISGAARPSRGVVRLDGADLHQLAPEQRGPHLGYLPQEAALFHGTVAANIARMAETPDPEKVVEAAKMADVHDMILRLPQGYDTVLADGGLPLSGGQRQRIGLARALYGRPRFVVLDEPNSNLDTAGESALMSALHELKEQGTTIVVVTHRPNVLIHADLVMVLEQGAITKLGPRDEVIPSLVRPARVA
ncbi:MAG: type I secretion system permease/ATPase [Geminicoccaceae bacterium]